MIQKVSIHTLILIKHNTIRTFCTSILWDNSNLNFICPSYRTYTKEFEYSRKLRLHQFLQIRNLFNYQSLQIRDLNFYNYTTQLGNKYTSIFSNIFGFTHDTPTSSHSNQSHIDKRKNKFKHKINIYTTDMNEQVRKQMQNQRCAHGKHQLFKVLETHT